MYMIANGKNDYMAGFVSASHPSIILLFPFHQDICPPFRGLPWSIREGDAIRYQ